MLTGSPVHGRTHLRGGWGNHGQGLFWTWWGNLIDILIFKKIFINIKKKLLPNVIVRINAT